MNRTPLRLRIIGGALALLAVGLPGPWGGDMIPAVRGARAADLPGDPEIGRRLFQRLDCVRCHSVTRGGRGTDIPPSLERAGTRARTAWMIEFLLEPEPLRFEAEGKRPDLRMPRVPMTRGEAEHLASYLALQRDETLESVAKATIERDDESLDQGAVLFEQYQCRGCHELAGRGGRVGPSLDGVGRRRQPSYMFALLLDPSGVIPGTAMKDADLWEEEAATLAAFLASLE